MFTGASPVLMVIAALAGLLFGLALLLAAVYGALRFATKYLQMRRDVEELKRAVQDLKQDR
jgi:hypothetical protein